MAGTSSTEMTRKSASKNKRKKSGRRKSVSGLGKVSSMQASSTGYEEQVDVDDDDDAETDAVAAAAAAAEAEAEANAELAESEARMAEVKARQRAKRKAAADKAARRANDGSSGSDDDDDGNDDDDDELARERRRAEQATQAMRDEDEAARIGVALDSKSALDEQRRILNTVGGSFNVMTLMTPCREFRPQSDWTHEQRQEGAADEIIRMITERGLERVLLQRDTVGGTPLHLCLLFGNMHLATRVLDWLGEQRRGEDLRMLCQLRYEGAKAFPKLLNRDGESASPYEGETCLHIALVKRHMPMIRTLVRHCPALVHMPVSRNAHFFVGTYDEDDADEVSAKVVSSTAASQSAAAAAAPSTAVQALLADGTDVLSRYAMTPCYYGTYPLMFAAATGNYAAFDYLLAHGDADLYGRDCYGNTLLHILVVQRMTHAYDYVRAVDVRTQRARLARTRARVQRMLDIATSSDAADAARKRLAALPAAHDRPLMESMTNRDLLTPLTLAADIGHADQFQHILTLQREVNWAYGPVACYIYPLAELDTLHESELHAAGSQQLHLTSGDAGDGGAGFIGSWHNGDDDADDDDDDDDGEGGDKARRQHRRAEHKAQRARDAAARLTASSKSKSKSKARRFHHDGEHKRALELIVERNHMELLQIPQIQELLCRKWTRYCKQRFQRRCFILALELVVLSMSVLLRPFPVPIDAVTATVGGSTFLVSPADDGSRAWDPQPCDSCANAVQYRSAREIGRIVCELIMVLCAVAKLWREGGEVLRHGLGAYWSPQFSYIRCENMLSMTYILTFCAAVVFRLSDSVDGERVAVVALLSCEFCYALSLLLASARVGPFVVMIFKMLTGDVLRFLLIYLLLLAGFSLSLYTLSDVEDSMDGAATACARWAHKLFMLMMGDADEFHDDINENFIVVSYMLFYAYIVIVSVLLLNLLIAMMGNTFSEVQEQAHHVWQLSWAQIIFSLEKEMTMAQRRADDITYWVTADGIRYLMVEELVEYVEDAPPASSSSPSTGGDSGSNSSGSDDDGSGEW